MTKKAQRFPNADLIRVLAMFMVILMHTVLNFVIRPDFFATKLWFLLEPIVAISKTCVLLFFMLSGFLVISKNRNYKENAIKTFRKILVPLGFFALVNIAYAWGEFAYDGNNFAQFAIQQGQRMISFPSSPLWFLVVLAFLYLFNPVWQLIFANEQKKKLARLITAISLTFSLLITIFQFLIQKKEHLFNNFTAWTSFAFFYLYGALVKNKWINVKNQKINLSMIVIGLSLTISGDFLTMWQKAHSIFSIWNDYTGSYLSFPVTMIAIGLFNFLISLDLTKFKTKTLTWFASLSFGIYLIHSYVIRFLMKTVGFDFNKLKINVYLYNIINISAVLLFSTLIVILLKKIPKLKAIIGE